MEKKKRRKKRERERERQRELNKNKENIEGFAMVSKEFLRRRELE